jgi:3-phenylpropionate/cinnamic acid dioxygenase small subunit
MREVGDMRSEKQWEIEQFLYREVRLLDERKFDEWLNLLSEDIRYWIPVRETRYGGGVCGEGELAYVDGDKKMLELRVKRLGTGLAWAEEPPSRTRHFVMNVEVVRDEGDEVEVHSNVLVFQSRYATYEQFYVGKREDRLRREDGQWKLAYRKIILDQALLPRTLSIIL